MSKYTVGHEDGDFEISEIKISDSAKTRNFIAISTLAICIAFIIGSAIYSLIKGEFSSLESVMRYAQAPIWVVLGYYFGANNSS